MPYFYHGMLIPIRGKFFGMLEYAILLFLFLSAPLPLLPWKPHPDYLCGSFLLDYLQLVDISIESVLFAFCSSFGELRMAFALAQKNFKLFKTSMNLTML